MYTKQKLSPIVKNTTVRPPINYLTEENKSFYTYQLKSSNGLQVVINCIDSSVKLMEALEDLGYSIKVLLTYFIKIRNLNKCLELN